MAKSFWLLCPLTPLEFVRVVRILCKYHREIRTLLSLVHQL